MSCRPSFGLVAGLLGLACSPVLACAKPSDLVLRIARIGPERFHVEYSFEHPILAMDFGAPVAEYRATAWKVMSPDLLLAQENGSERLVHREGSSFSRAEIEISAYSAYPSDRYVPMARFSDGGVALFLGFLVGDVAASDTFEIRKIHVQAASLEGETAVAPRILQADRRAFAYFGAQKPLDVGYARLIADPAAPSWLVPTLQAVLRATTRIYAERLGLWPREAPLVLLAARDLDSLESYSVKGGAVAGQLVFTLRGKELVSGSHEVRRTLERLIAHELAHLWQEVVPAPGGEGNDPWIYEGGAEAMAVAALVEGGLWSRASADSFASAAENDCRDALGDESLATAVASGRWDVVYPCGFRAYAESGKDPFAVWRRMTEQSSAQRRPYTQELFDAIVARRE